MYIALAVEDEMPFFQFFELLHTSLYQALAVLGKKPSVANLAFKTASDLMDGRLFHWLLAKNAQMHTTGGQLGREFFFSESEPNVNEGEKHCLNRFLG